MKQVLLIILLFFAVDIGIFLFVVKFNSAKSTASRNVSKEELPANERTTQRQKVTEVISDIPSISVELINRQFLAQRLDQAQFWDNKEDSTLTIHLTDKVQPLGQTKMRLSSEKEFIYQAYNHVFDSKTKKDSIFIYLNPDMVTQTVPQELTKQYSAEILDAVFEITHPSQNSTVEELNKKIKQKNEFKKTLEQLPQRSFLSITKS